jgi:hypothetical protein
MSDYRWVALGEALEERSGKLMEAIGEVFTGDKKLCTAKAVAIGLLVADLETALASIRGVLEQVDGVGDACGEESQIGCWVCRPVVPFQRLDGDVVEVGDLEALAMESRGEGVRLESVRGPKVKVEWGGECEGELQSAGDTKVRIVH